MREYLDLIYRLRSAHESSVQRGLGSNIFCEAADELERLRKEVDTLNSKLESMAERHSAK